MERRSALGFSLIKIASIYMLASVALGFYMGATHEYALLSVHSHIGLLGWMTMALTGLIYVVAPRCDGNKGSQMHFWLHQPLTMSEAMYETDSAVSQYCKFHYGKAYFGVANFSARCAEVCCRHTQGQSRRHAMDLGCAVGRAAFELAREFDRVTGIDFSARIIRVALQLKEKGVAHFELVEEGELVSYHKARLAELGLDGGGSSRVLPRGCDESEAAIHGL